MVTAECHAHIFMDGVDYKKAAAAHENGPREDLIREHLAAYQKAGISYVRDGGDPYGAGVLARSLRRSTGSHTAHRFLRFTGRAVMEKLSDVHFQTGKSIARLCVKYAVRAEILSGS